MEQKKRNNDRIVAGGCAILMAGAMTFGVLKIRTSQDLRTELDQERQRAATLASQMKVLENELADRTIRISDVSAENRELRERSELERMALAEAQRKAAAAAISRRPDVSRKQLDELKEEQARLERMLREANARSNDLTAENSRLRDRNGMLADELARYGQVAASINNTLVETTRGKKKEKLTNRARRTQHFNIDLELPEEVAKDIRTTVVGPKGRTIESTDASISAATSVGEATASTANTGMGRKTSRVKMKIGAKEKLMPGTYRVEVYSGNKHLGTTRTTLR